MGIGYRIDRKMRNYPNVQLPERFLSSGHRHRQPRWVGVNYLLKLVEHGIPFGVGEPEQSDTDLNSFLEKSENQRYLTDGSQMRHTSSGYFRKEQGKNIQEHKITWFRNRPVAVIAEQMYYLPVASSKSVMPKLQTSDLTSYPPLACWGLILSGAMYGRQPASRVFAIEST